MRIGLVSCLAFAFCALVPDRSVAADPESAAYVDPVIVTATRTSVAASETLAATTVIDRDEIERRGVTSLQELLSGEPGIQVSNNGGLGKASAIFIRGTESEHVLYLVDGVRVGSATLGTTAIEYLPLAQIERIEIVRGPRSSLYGSEAVGGVVQIFTRGQAAAGTESDVSVGSGSHATETASGSLHKHGPRADWALTAGYTGSDGYRSCTGSATPPVGGCYVDDPTSKGYHNASYSGNLGYRPTENLDLGLFALRAEGGTAFAGTYVNHEDFIQQVLGLSARWRAAPGTALTLRLGSALDDAMDSLDFIPMSRFVTRRDSGSLQLDQMLAVGHVLSAGLDFTRDRISSDTAFARTSRSESAGFVEYQGRRNAIDWVLSARSEHDQQFGDAITYNAATGIRLGESVRVRASAGTAFKAPSFDDLYYPFFGNPALKAEHSRSVEFGLDWIRGATHASAAIFETRVRDLIGYDLTFHAANIDSARIPGVELAAGTRRGRWRIEGNAALLDPRNQTPGSAEEGNLLPRRARWTAALDVGRALGPTECALRLAAAGRRYEDLSNTEPLGGYLVAELLVHVALAPAWSLDARIANLTDRRYELARYYPQDRRAVLITVRYRPPTRPTP